MAQPDNLEKKKRFALDITITNKGTTGAKTSSAFCCR